jgi:3',5'-cyclic AMP phosphodiesterase CpdA
MRTIVHLSDLHFGRLDRRLLAPLVDAIKGVGPDLIAVSGDLTQRARRGQFVQARDFLRQLEFPTLVVPGNHDVPLFNLAARFLSPLSGYRRFISEDLEPSFADEEISVVGLNSARSFTRGEGRINEAQVIRACERLSGSPARSIKIIVTHHPFDLPDTHDPRHLIGRAHMAMSHLAKVGADLFLAGHLHLSHVGCTAERYKIEGHAALVVQAGTISTRGRGERNSFNVLRLQRPEITVERLTWDGERRRFESSWQGAFRHGPDGWNPAATAGGATRPAVSGR